MTLPTLAVTIGEVKETLRDSLGEFYEPLYKLFWAVWSSNLLKPSQEIYWLYLLSYMTLALGVYLWQCKIDAFSINNFLRFLFPQSVYAHKSALLDYKYYIPADLLNNSLQFGVWVITVPGVAEYCKSFLVHTFGPMGSHLDDGLSARVIFTASLVLALDAGNFVGHYLEHKIQFFWEFHKVHHSAEVLTPITNYRLHPMDRILQGSFMSLGVGTVIGVTGYFYDDLPRKITILEVSAIAFFAYYFTANLRHSHVWLSYGWTLSHVFYSPAMHQIHHSCAERHVDKNFGLIFSCWDYLAGTLYVPGQKEDLKLGLKNEEHHEFKSVWALFVLPLKKAASVAVSVILPQPGTALKPGPAVPEGRLAISSLSADRRESCGRLSKATYDLVSDNEIHGRTNVRITTDSSL
jgi:sterol desaturase/sphingolipid hydroxylase (fatty acid hydroxylase superfamily)